MLKLKRYIKKRELVLAGISIIGVVVLFINLTIALYLNNIHQAEMAFKNDAFSRTSDLRNYFKNMETMLSIFISNIETMQISGIADRDLIIQMQKDVLRNDNNAVGISLIYESNAYDGQDEAYINNPLYNWSGIFAPSVWRNDDTFEVKPFSMPKDNEAYDDVKNTGECLIQYGTYDTEQGTIPVISLCSPIYNKNGMFIGMGAIHYSINFLEKYLDEHVFNDLICLVVADKNGNVIASSPKLEEINDDEILSAVKDISNISDISIFEMQYIKTRGLARSDFMLITDAISLENEQHKLSDRQSQFIMMHVAERTTILGYLITKGFSNFNGFIAIITIVSFIALLFSFLTRKKKDALTGVYSRDIIENGLPATISRAVSAQRDVCLILTDIDFFKKVNDTYGHIAGDIVLKNFSQIIQQCIRSKDWVSRYGGEEFLIFLPDANKEAGRAVAERIRKELEDSPVIVDGEIINVTASFGIASLLHDNLKTAQDMIKLADQNLYSAKESGRNRVC